ncbi:hypothetical protein BFJ69_g11450 [Fusarium oxysporum]|uniref:Nephrocystin 3-like N-terminal domain-containing protein n=1 Tax=Fusarium oxysporum TaxID=5507 RepID=A0A420MSC6_FUSOX|nr:hypothetical protein BFJ69_g11450 [Fusarium oxysporum]
MASRLGSSDLYTIAWIASLPIERAAATALLHEIHDEPDGFVQHEADNNSYSWGRIGEHNIVIASLQAGVYGTISAATTASDLICSLPHIRFGLLVGIGGGIAKPDEDQDIRLGDIVVSQPDGMTGGVVQYDFGKAKADGCWEQKGSLNKPPPVLLHALASLQARHERMPSRIPGLLETMWNANNRFMAKGKRNYTHPGAENDRLYKPEYSHVGGGTCSKCDSEWEVEREERESTDPEIHYGIIASGDSLIKDAATRDKLSDRQQFLCVEMEAAGLMDKFPCLVIRGICDYADSHKNDRWQRYAAATATAFAVELLEHVPAKQVQATRKVIEAVKSIEDKLDTLSASVQNIDSNIALDRLPDAEGARYDSQAEEHNSMCLANTRVDLLKDLSNWVEDDTSKPILWLNARQLARIVPGYAQAVKKTLDSDSDVVSKAISKQFAELIEAPLKELAKTPLAFVIDALDECEREDEIKSLIDILSRASSIRQYLRILITSRPDLPIRLGLAKANGAYEALVLHDMPVDTIKHDIMTFLVSEFERIRVNFNIVVPTELELPPDWPEANAIDKLTKMAVPLFIFPATVCRFVSNYKIGGPSEQLHKYFQLSNNNYGSHLGQTYGPVLRSIVTCVSEEDRRQIVEQTCHIVGSIVILGSPLSIMALSKLLDIPVVVVHSRLNALHSILNIPSSLHEPVRLLHISLRDYLTDPSQKQKNEFWVDERRTHLRLFKNSLRVMYTSLKEDICNLVWPGTQRTDIRATQVASYLYDELQYACRHWAYHFQKIDNPLLNLEEVLLFLQKHLFHWVKALSVIGRIKESFQGIKILQTIAKESNTRGQGEEDDIKSKIEEPTTGRSEEQPTTSNDEGEPADRSDNRCIIRVWLKLLHMDHEEFIGPLPVQGDKRSFQFSPDSKLLALIKDTGSAVILRLDPAGCPQETRLAHCERSHRRRPEFSPDSSVLTIMSSFTGNYAVWKTETSECIRFQKMNPFLGAIFYHGSSRDKSVSVALTGNSSIMVAGAFSEESWPSEIREDGILESNNGRLEIRWLDSGEVICTFDCQEHVEFTQFAPDHTVLASICKDGSIRTWRVETGECLTLFESAKNCYFVSLSPDLTLLGSAETTKTISVWANDTSGTDKNSSERSDPIESVVLSLDRTLAASSSYYGVVRVWDMNTNDCIHESDDGFQKRADDKYGYPELFQFSKDNKYLFVSRTTPRIRRDTRYYDTVPYLGGHFRVWDVRTGERIISHQTKIHYRYSEPNFRGSALSVAPDDHWIVSVRDRNVTIIAVGTFSVAHKLALTEPILDVSVSPDSRFIIVLSSKTPEIIPFA